MNWWDGCDTCKYWDSIEYELNPNLDAVWIGWCVRKKKETWEYEDCGWFKVIEKSGK